MNEEEYSEYLETRERQKYTKRLNFYQNLANDEISRIVTGLFDGSCLSKCESEDQGKLQASMVSPENRQTYIRFSEMSG